MQHTPAPIPFSAPLAANDNAAVIAALPAVASDCPSVTVERASIASAMKLIAGVVEKRNSIPILGNVLLHMQNGSLQAFGTDLDVCVRIDLPAHTTGDFAVTMPAHMLESLLRKSDADWVSLNETAAPVITMRKRGNEEVEDVTPGRTAVRMGTSSTSLQTLPVDHLPQFEIPAAAATFALPAADLCAMLKRTRSCLSTEETRYYLNGVYMHHIVPHGVARYNGSHGTLRFAATNGHRMAVAELPAPHIEGDFPVSSTGSSGAIIPCKAVAMILRAFDAKPRKPKKGEAAAPPVMATVALSMSHIVVTCGPVRIESKLIAGTYPDYQRVIPTNTKRLVIEAGDFAAAIDRVTTVSSECGRAVKLQLMHNAIKLIVRNPDAGASIADVECDYSAEQFDIGFNATYLLGILAQFKGKVVELLLDDPGSPTIIRERGASGGLFVLMPMRV